VNGSKHLWQKYNSKLSTVILILIFRLAFAFIVSQGMLGLANKSDIMLNEHCIFIIKCINTQNNNCILDLNSYLDNADYYWSID